MSNAPAVTAATGFKQARATVNNPNRHPRGVSTLLYACQQGDVDKVRRILRAQPAALSERDRTRKTALHYCCTSDHISAAQAADVVLMAAPDLIDGRDEDGFTPLHLAVIAGNMPLVTFLLANNADINAVDNEKHTVVHWATVCGETVALRAVLAAGAPVSTPDVHGGYPLHYAAQMCGGDKDSSLGLQVLHTLLSHEEIKVTVEDGDGRPPLLWAASAGSAKAILALIRAGTPVEAHDKDGLTALHCAASRGHADCIDTLLTLCGASPDVIDSNGCTALHYAVTLGHADATALLLAHTADPNRQDRKGRSPAHCGCAKGQFETVKILGAHNANLWLRNARGDLPLHEAAASGRRDLVRWLLEARPSHVNVRNNDGRCPLHLAALNDNADMCKILLDAGAQINPVLRTSKNVFMTPLDCALQRGFRATAKFLQLHGGVPANRLGGIPRGPADSAVSLQIRDDVTFWGGSSSESEKEEESKTKSKKKAYRRKFNCKYEKRRGPIFVSECESKLDSDGSTSKKTKTPEKNKSSQFRNDFPFLGNNNSIPPGEIFIYANEVNINEKFGGVQIQHKGEVLISETSKMTVPPSEVAQTQSPKDGGLSATNEKQDKRPKSAKRARAKSKTESANERETKSLVDTNKLTIEEQIQKKSQETIESVHSARSNTSHEDGETHEELVVEASIHSPPKTPTETQLEAPSEVVERRTTPIGSEEVAPKPEEMPKTSENRLQTISIVETAPTPIPTPSPSPTGTPSPTPEVAQKTIEEIREVSPRIEVLPENKITLPQDATPTDSKGDGEATEVATLEKTKDEQDGNKKTIGEEEIKDSQIKSETKRKEEEEINNKAQIETKEQSIDTQDKTRDVPLQPTETEMEAAAKTKESSSTQLETKALEQKHEQQKKMDSETKQSKTAKHVEIQSETSSELPSSCRKSNDEPKPSETKLKERRQRSSYKKRRKTQETVEKSSGPRKTSKTPESSIDAKSSDESQGDASPSTSSSRSSTRTKEHRSFKVLDEKEGVDLAEKQHRKSYKQRSSAKKQRSQSEEKSDKNERLLRRSKIPTPVSNLKSSLSKSDKHLEKHNRGAFSSIEPRVPSLPNIHDVKDLNLRHTRSISNLSAPLASTYSDDFESGSDAEERNSATKKKRLRKRSKSRGAKSAGSDYESSNLIDSGFEPSPRSTRIPKWKNVSERGVNMSSVTQTIQSNIRRYHLERKIFQHLLDLKRLQIRSGQHNEAVLVKRAIDAYHRSCAATVGAGRYISPDLTFKSFEHFLYSSLRKIQRNGNEHLHGLPETPRNPLLCTQSTHRCDHAIHAYTGVPCAAYLPKMDHHSIPKIGFDCKPSSFLPKISPKNTVTLELCHGSDKQVISLPAERLDQNKRYYVTFTVKGKENGSSTTPAEEANAKISSASHRHPKSD